MAESREVQLDKMERKLAKKPTNAMKIPPKVAAFLAVEKTNLANAAELLDYLCTNNTTYNANAACIAYTLGCDYATARSISSWMVRERAR